MTLATKKAAERHLEGYHSFRDQRSGLYTFRRDEIVDALTEFALKELRGNGCEGVTICRRCGAEHRDGVTNMCCM